jgi:RNA polymerase sigma factor (sigma-70 family)
MVSLHPGSCSFAAPILRTGCSPSFTCRYGSFRLSEDHMKTHQEFSRFMEGDPSFFEELYGIHCRNFIRWAAWRWNLPEEDAYDLYYEAICRGLAKARFDPDIEISCRVSTWLAGIACKVLLERIKFNNHSNAYSNDTLHTGEHSNHNEGVIHFDKESIKYMINSCLSRLHPDDQQLIKLLFFENRGAEEIASIMGLTVTIVWQRKCRVLKKLEAIFKNKFPEDWGSI